MGWIVLTIAFFLFLIIYTMKNIKEAFEALEDKNMLIRGMKAFFIGIIGTIIDGL